MQFDFNLSPNGAQQLDVRGKFFKLVSSTGKVRVTTDTGDSIDLLPGQGVSHVNFQWLSVKDRSGATNAGVLLAGGFDFSDDRITGSVEVIDGGKSRTNSDSACMGYGYVAAAAGQSSYVQLLNPAGSGMNLYIERVSFMCGSAAQGIGLRRCDAAIANLYGQGSRKRMGAVASVAQVRTEANAAVLGQGNWLMSIPPAVSMYTFTEPLQVPPGTGVIMANMEFTQSIGGAFEYFEEPI
jgi:hypothetical protein